MKVRRDGSSPWEVIWNISSYFHTTTPPVPVAPPFSPFYFACVAPHFSSFYIDCCPVQETKGKKIVLEPHFGRAPCLRTIFLPLLVLPSFLRKRLNKWSIMCRIVLRIKWDYFVEDKVWIRTVWTDQRSLLCISYYRFSCMTFFLEVKRFTIWKWPIGVKLMSRTHILYWKPRIWSGSLLKAI